MKVSGHFDAGPVRFHVYRYVNNSLQRQTLKLRKTLRIPTTILQINPNGEFNYQSTYWSFLCFRMRLTLKYVQNKPFSEKLMQESICAMNTVCHRSQNARVLNLLTCTETKIAGSEHSPWPYFWWGKSLWSIESGKKSLANIYAWDNVCYSGATGYTFHPNNPLKHKHLLHFIQECCVL